MEWNFLNCSLADDGADRSGCRLDNGDVRRDEHLFGDSADVHLEILDRSSGDLDGYLICHLSLKALDSCFDRINADWQGSKLVVTIAVGLGCALQSRASIASDDGCVRQNGSF